jgi:5-oxoprolinase (ATP-hydrolysing)
MGSRIYVDRGGTFTDIVVVEETGAIRLRKIPSDEAVVGDLCGPDPGALTFGTTVATNALLERRTVPTLLIVTAGLGDLVRIRDMRRPSLFEPDAVWPEPLCCRVLELEGRMAADGSELEPLVLPERWPREVLEGIEAVAVVLMHAPRNPAHERAVAAALRERHPELFVVCGHEVSASVGYLSRIETALVEASATPILQRALRADRIPPRAWAVRSDGSLCEAQQLGAADAVLSGPASGVLAVAAVAEAAGVRRAIGLDMGGTSTDVCLVDTAAPLPRRQGEVEVAGVWLRRPMLDVETIAAGGGSVLWDDGQLLHVGPASAGASPGPQCYGRGGPPTLTDAALSAGLLDASAFSPPLDPSRIVLPGPAGAFLDLARQQMADAIRRLAARRGVDPAEHALVAFGGAAGQHAAWVAELLSIEEVLVHPAASVLCAWGQQLARREQRLTRPLWRPLSDWAAVQQALAALAAEVEIPEGGELLRAVEVRHTGTDHAIELPATSPEQIARDFVLAHRARFGFDRDLPLEVVDVHVRAVAPRPALPPLDRDEFGLGDQPRPGPARLDSPTTSVAVPEGWVAERAHGLLRLRRVERPRPPETSLQRTPHAVSLWASRLMRVATLAGAMLERTARSVNIRERLDFSCAVFDGAGNLVANAPHVPVHLGAMGETVRDLLAAVPEPQDGQHWLTNDPAAGGSHLPDLTVVSPVSWDGVRLFVACRAHHVDVGGLTPGSMPPRSARLSDEGFVVRRLPLLQDGRLRPDLDEHLAGCRQLEVVRADLEAQIAANVTAARELRSLGAGPVVARWAGHLLEVADEAMASVMSRLPEQATARDELDGLPLCLALRREQGALVVDLSGTGGPHPGNLNAPPAVVRAAVLYALVVLAGRRLPLNDGVLRRVRLVLPAPSLISPAPGAAVAGGNVETSQRLADLVLVAAGHGAASGGTMSNLTLGGAGWSLYETVGCGQGASVRGPGPSGRQVHMTNTRATDPEVLEQRLPLRLRRFSLRGGSGGAGEHAGGDGLIRELEVLVPARAALLATRRDRGAQGQQGGEPGEAGLDELMQGGTWRPWDGELAALQPGDRVRVQTPGGGGWGTLRRLWRNP